MSPPQPSQDHTHQQHQPETHLIVLLPFDRPQGFVDPPPPTPWDSEKEIILNSVLEQSGGVGNVDWTLLSESLETPVPILLYRAKARYARQLEALNSGSRGRVDGLRRASAAVSTREGSASGVVEGSVGGMGGGRAGEQQPSRSPEVVSPGAPPPPPPPPSFASPRITTNPSHQSSRLTRPPKPSHPPIPAPAPTQPQTRSPPQHRRRSSSSTSSSSSSSSSASSSSSTSPVYASALLSPSTLTPNAPIQSVAEQLRALSSFGGGAFSLPSREAVNTPRSQQQVASTSGTRGAGAAGSSGKGDGGKDKERERERDVDDVSPTPSSPTRVEGVGSGTSSFSDLSNASLTQSALEEAAMSAMNRAGGSRISMFSKLGGTLR